MAPEKQPGLYPKPRISFSFAYSQLKFLLLVPPAYLFGRWLDNLCNYRMIRFRDKSALFGGEVKEGDPPSWPKTWP